MFKKYLCFIHKIDIVFHRESDGVSIFFLLIINSPSIIEKYNSFDG